MKEKSIWKELLNRAGWLLIFLLATILYQIPIGVTAILTVRTDSCWYFNCSFSTIYFWSS